MDEKMFWGVSSFAVGGREGEGRKKRQTEKVLRVR